MPLVDKTPWCSMTCRNHYCCKKVPGDSKAKCNNSFWKMRALCTHTKSKISRNVQSSENSSGLLGLFHDNERLIIYDCCRQKWFIGVLSHIGDKPITCWQPFFKESVLLGFLGGRRGTSFWLCSPRNWWFVSLKYRFWGIVVMKL